jgi:tRNA G26 N,N-dimethylase Trm1
MVEMNISVKGINELKRAFQKRPDVVKKYINDAISRSLFIIENNANDNNFQFKTPRSRRTGYLQRSFKFGIITKDFYGSIGPTVEYAPYVHANNEFMERIARVSQPLIEREFNDAVASIADEIASLAS